MQIKELSDEYGKRRLHPMFSPIGYNCPASLAVARNNNNCAEHEYINMYYPPPIE